jgi:hypothetical protein
MSNLTDWDYYRPGYHPQGSDRQIWLEAFEVEDPPPNLRNRRSQVRILSGALFENP